ncbi:T4SS efffector SepA family protein [Thalassovita aquimarina]|uniref:Uncharacterized protein n=1 Tax=Thalassovita aquimarina TaxID=2785917 RepID=A0ABS5HPI3_9RHOB|nr:hypothetical protein [Thalassovita aquimarina]MBR9650865.1 hypothetical protein [Thalassovita aquimarina]
MPTIEITEHDFLRLQRYAEPLVDTATTAFTKVLDMLESINAAEEAVPSMSEKNGRKVEVFGAGSIPPLRHAKLMAGSFRGKSPDKATWDAMVRLALETLFSEYGDVQMLRGTSGANVVQGQKTDEGYKYLPDLGFSYQGVSAEDAVEIIVRSARVLNANAWIDFVWRNKADAFRPGEQGRIEI